MRALRLAVLIGVIFLAVRTGNADAFIFINEFLADPAATLAGDANGDGVVSSSQDEFVELLNISGEAVDIGGWYLNDALSTRHIFASGTIVAPYSYLVVFGGGAPSLTDISWYVASTGALSLNNTADAISLYAMNGDIMDSITYGSEANRDQSLVRFPEGAQSPFIQHSQAPGSNGKLFSPGVSIDGSPRNHPTVPEPITLLSVGIGCLLMLVRGNMRHMEA